MQVRAVCPIAFERLPVASCPFDIAGDGVAREFAAVFHLECSIGCLPHDLERHLIVSELGVADGGFAAEAAEAAGELAVLQLQLEDGFPGLAVTTRDRPFPCAGRITGKDGKRSETGGREGREDEAE